MAHQHTQHITLDCFNTTKRIEVNYACVVVHWKKKKGVDMLRHPWWCIGRPFKINKLSYHEHERACGIAPQKFNPA